MEQNTKKLLIVEDEPMIRHALVEAFDGEKDITVLAAHDGKEALGTALNEHPDLIMTDVLMPEMNGLEMVAALREDEWGKKAQIVFLSNSDDADKKAEARAKGVYDFFIKSNMDPKEMVKVARSKMFAEEGKEDVQKI